MSDDDNTDHIRDQEHAESPPPPPILPQNETVLPNPEENEPDDHLNVTVNLPAGTRAVEWLQLGINAALAVIGVVAISIYGGQLNVMRGQLAQMAKQYPELQKSAQAAHDSAKAAMDSVEQTKQIVKSAQTQASDANGSLRDTEAFFTIQESAYVSIDLKDIPHNSVAVPGTLALNINLLNWGKTIAHVDASNAHLVLKRATDSEPVIPNPNTPFSPTVELIPGQTNVMFDARSEKLTPDDFSHITDPNFTLYVYGRVSYMTVFGKLHHTEYCQSLFFQGRTWNPCKNGNRMY